MSDSALHPSFHLLSGMTSKMSQPVCDSSHLVKADSRSPVHQEKHIKWCLYCAAFLLPAMLQGACWSLAGSAASGKSRQCCRRHLVASFKPGMLQAPVVPAQVSGLQGSSWQMQAVLQKAASGLFTAWKVEMEHVFPCTGASIQGSFGAGHIHPAL